MPFSFYSSRIFLVTNEGKQMNALNHSPLGAVLQLIDQVI